MDGLEKLAKLYGISSDYLDVDKNIHYTTNEVRKFFLQNLGVPCQTEEQTQKQINLFEKQQYENGLDAAYAFFDNETDKKIKFYYPVDKAQETLSYQINAEDGKVYQGKINLAQEKAIESNNVDGQEYYTYMLDFLPDLPMGYFDISIISESNKFSAFLIMAPQKCFLKEGMEEGQFHCYGLAAQLYALRSKQNMGVGDFGDAEALIPILVKNGCDVLGLSPLGMTSPQNRRDVSPYRALNRCFVNYLYLDLKKEPDYQNSQEVQLFVNNPDVQSEIKRLQQANMVDYYAVFQLKTKILRLMYAYFKQQKSRKEAFEAWKKSKGKSLYNTCLFEALLEANSDSDYAKDWRFWANNYDDIHSFETQKFAQSHQDDIDFYAYCHWLAALQLEKLAECCKKAGMKVGLYLDAPIGASASGVEVWQEKNVYAENMGVGAPVDPMCPKGQSWGFAPYHPLEIRKNKYRPFIELIRENMTSAQALRIDHAMGLMRLFWVYYVPNNPVVQGAYVYYNMKEMVAILCVESQRSKCLVIGEDLGTVPDGFREYMAEHGLMSNKVLFLETEKDGNYFAPNEYGYLALAQTTTHDQATAHGFWLNADLDAFEKCNLFVSEEQREKAFQNRQKERTLLTKAFIKEDVFVSDEEKQCALDSLDGHMVPKNIEKAFTAYVARSKSAIFLQRFEDVYKQVEMENIPGTIFEYPNWRIKSPVNIEEIDADNRFAEIFDLIKKERP